MRRNSSSDLDARHLATDNQNLSTTWPSFPEKTLEVSVLAAVYHWDRSLLGETLRDNRLAKEPRSNDKKIEMLRLGFML